MAKEATLRGLEQNFECTEKHIEFANENNHEILEKVVQTPDDYKGRFLYPLRLVNLTLKKFLARLYTYKKIIKLINSVTSDEERQKIISKYLENYKLKLIQKYKEEYKDKSDEEIKRLAEEEVKKMEENVRKTFDEIARIVNDKQADILAHILVDILSWNDALRRARKIYQEAKEEALYRAVVERITNMELNDIKKLVDDLINWKIDEVSEVLSELFWDALVAEIADGRANIYAAERHNTEVAVELCKRAMILKKTKDNK